MILLAAKSLLLMLVLVAAGCQKDQPATRPSSMRERALRDPGGFKPEMEQEDISGGGLMDLDSKGLKRDLDHVLNP